MVGSGFGAYYYFIVINFKELKGKKKYLSGVDNVPFAFPFV